MEGRRILSTVRACNALDKMLQSPDLDLKKDYETVTELYNDFEALIMLKDSYAESGNGRTLNDFYLQTMLYFTSAALGPNSEHDRAFKSSVLRYFSAYDVFSSLAGDEKVSHHKVESHLVHVTKASMGTVRRLEASCAKRTRGHLFLEGDEELLLAIFFNWCDRQQVTNQRQFRAEFYKVCIVL